MPYCLNMSVLSRALCSAYPEVILLIINKATDSSFLLLTNYLQGHFKRTGNKKWAPAFQQLVLGLGKNLNYTLKQKGGGQKVTQNTSMYTLLGLLSQNCPLVGEIMFWQETN